MSVSSFLYAFKDVSRGNESHSDSVAAFHLIHPTFAFVQDRHRHRLCLIHLRLPPYAIQTPRLLTWGIVFNNQGEYPKGCAGCTFSR